VGKLSFNPNPQTIKPRQFKLGLFFYPLSPFGGVLFICGNLVNIWVKVK
jgi:hypothetical protein